MTILNLDISLCRYAFFLLCFIVYHPKLSAVPIKPKDSGNSVSQLSELEPNSNVFSYFQDTWLFRFGHNFVDYLLIVVPVFAFVYLVKQNILLPTSVIQNKFVKLFVYGKEAFEYGLLDKKLPTVKSESDNNITKPKNSLLQNSTVKLLYCFFGLQISYLTWGILQEKIMTQNYKVSNSFYYKTISQDLITFYESKDNDITVNYIRFRNAQFLVFVNRILAFLVSVFVLAYQNRNSFGHYILNTNQPPFYMYMYCSLSNILSSWCQYEALKFVSFPAQVLSKGCKMIPVMIMSQCLRGHSHKKVEWLFALFISLGMSIFLFNEHQESSSEHHKNATHISEAPVISGIVILALYLTFDSFTSNWQSSLFDQYKISTIHMMVAVNFYSVLFTLISLIQQSDFLSAINLIFVNSQLFRDCLLLSICSTAGQLFIFYTISSFGAIVFTLIMTLRQAFAILLSCLIYSHKVSVFGMFGIFIIFASLFGKIYYNTKTKRRKT